MTAWARGVYPLGSEDSQSPCLVLLYLFVLPLALSVDQACSCHMCGAGVVGAFLEHWLGAFPCVILPLYRMLDFVKASFVLL